VIETANAAGYLLSHRVNDAFIAVNRLLKQNEEVYWIGSETSANGVALGRGAMFVTARPTTLPLLRTLAKEVGLTFHATGARPSGSMMKLQPVRVGLWDRYGGSMPSGWIRWLLEQYEFPFEVVYPQALDAGNLNSRFDVLIFPDEAIPASDSERRGRFGGGPPPAESIPAEFRPWLGNVTVAKTMPQLKAFVEAGGTLIAIGSSTSVAAHFALPLADALTELTTTGSRSLPRDKFFIPGSILRASVDATHPLAWGMGDAVDVFFDNSPAFHLLPNAALAGVRAVAWYPDATPLRSGWAWGQHYLNGAVAAAEAQVGKGRIFLFGPEITFRGQPHGTFKFLFNGIYYGPRAAATATEPTAQ
jgi:hypothetical protein